MANKYRKRAAAKESTPTPAAESAPEKGLLEGIRDLPGNLWEAAKTVGSDIAEIPGGARAALEQLPTAVPGGQYVTDKVRMALGQSGEDIESTRAQLATEHPIGTALGDIGAMAAGGALLPGAGAGSAVKQVLTQAGQAAVLAPAYKLGQVADQAVLRGDALHVEAIANSFSFQDSLEAAGLTLLMGAPMVGVEAAGQVGPAAARRAKTEAARLFPKAAQKLGMSEEAVGQLAMDKNMLRSETSAKKLMQEAGTRMGQAADKAQFSQTEIEAMALDLAAMEKAAEPNQTLASARKQVRAQAARLLDVQTGAELEGIIQGFKAEARAANRAGKSQKGQFYGDVAESLRDHMGKNLDVVDPKVGAEYRAAVQDYNTYAKMAPEAAAGAKKQVRGRDVANVVARGAVAPALGYLAGPAGVAGGLAADLMIPQVTAPIRGKNTAVLMDRISKTAPGQQHIARASEVVSGLLGVAKAGTVAIGRSGTLAEEKDVPKRYAGVAKALRNSMADPSGTAKQLRSQLNFLPPHIADAVAANSMNKLQCLALALPPETGPATAFGIQTDVPDRAKREFLRRAQDAFDPYGAVLSGSPMRVREAEKYNPETINDLRKQVIAKIAENPQLPYSTKRRVAGILGVAGVPTQDPMVGATVQQVLRLRRQAQDSQGQMKSARQMNANLKQNSATLTRAQKILNNGE